MARLDIKVKMMNPDAFVECGACPLDCAASPIYVKSRVGCATAVIDTFLGRKAPVVIV